MGDWSVVVNGVTLEVAAGTVPTLSIPNNGIVSFSAQVKNTNIARDNVAFGKTVVLSFMGTQMVSGYCEAPRRHRDNIIVYGKEQANDLTRELILIGGTYHVEYEAIDASTILAAILALRGFTLDAVNRPGPQNISVRFYTKNILYGVVKVANTLGMDWYFVGTVLHMVADRGVNRGQIFNFSIRAFDEDYDAIRNQIILFYIDVDGDRQYVTGDNAASQGTYGVIQDPYTDYEVFDAVTAQLLADAIAADKGALQTVLQLVQPIAEVIARSLGPGDDITLVSSQHGITTGTSYEIRKLSYSGDRVTIEAGTMALDNQGTLMRKIEAMATPVLVDVTVDQMPYGTQGWSTDLEIRPGVGGANKHNSFEWDDGAAGNAELIFGDGTTVVVTLGNFAGLAANTTFIYYVKTDEDPTTLYLAAGHGDLDEVGHLPVVKIRTPAAAATTQEVEVWPVRETFDTTPQIGSNFLSAGVIITPDFRTAWNVGEAGGPAGIRVTPTEIAGYTGGAVKGFYIANDGVAYFLGGLAWLNASALHIKHDGGAGRSSGVIVYDNAGNPMGFLSVAGDHIALASDPDGYVVMSNWLGDSYIKIFDVGASHGQIELTTHNGKNFSLNPAGQTVSTADIDPSADHTKELGYPTKTWQYYNPRTNLAGRPAAAVGIVGLVWCTREAAADERYWLCYQKADNSYDWLELGVGGGVHGRADHTDRTRYKFYPFYNDVDANASLGLFNSHSFVNMPDGVLTEVPVEFRVPDDFVTFLQMKLVWSATRAPGAANMRWRLTAGYGHFNESFQNHIDAPAYGVSAWGGSEWMHEQLSPNALAMAGLALGDYIGVKVWRDGGHGDDTIGATVKAWGTLLIYTADH